MYEPRKGVYDPRTHWRCIACGTVNLNWHDQCRGCGASKFGPHDAPAVPNFNRGAQSLPAGTLLERQESQLTVAMIVWIVVLGLAVFMFWIYGLGSVRAAENDLARYRADCNRPAPTSVDDQLNDPGACTSSQEQVEVDDDRTHGLVGVTVQGLGWPKGTTIHPAASDVIRPGVFLTNVQMWQGRVTAVTLDGKLYLTRDYPGEAIGRARGMVRVAEVGMIVVGVLAIPCALSITQRFKDRRRRAAGVGPGDPYQNRT